MFRIDKNAEITPQTVCKFIEKHKKLVPSFQKLENYYEGRHAILSRSKDSRLANNRLVCNHAKHITDTATGYLTGNPVQYGSKSKANIQSITELLAACDSDTQDIDIAHKASIYGKAFELVYLSDSEKPQPMLASLSPQNAFVVYDNTVSEQPLFGVYYITNDNQIHVYASTENSIIEFDTDESLNIISGQKVTENYFHGVSIIEYYNNSIRQGDFEGVINLIDAYNILQSDRVNDKEQFVNAILLIKGQILGDNTDEETEAYKQIRDMGLLLLNEGSSAEWLTRQFDESSVEILRKSIENDIHKFSGVPCMTDENFASNSSGVAMKYKLLGFEQITKIKERYFKEGLKLRLQLIANFLELKGNAKTDTSDIEITLTRSLPANELELSQLINNLSEFVPLPQLLKLLPFIKDPEETAKQIEQQRKEDEQKAYNFPVDSYEK